MAKCIQNLVNDILDVSNVDSLKQKEHDNLVNKMESTSKMIERFLKNVYGALGIDLAKYTQGRKYQFDEWLSKYITDKIQSYSLPVNKEIKQSFEYADRLSVECLDVIKHFNDANFDGEMYEKVKKKIEVEKEKTYKKFDLYVKNQKVAMKEFNKYKLALIGRSISLDEIDIFISEVYRCYEEYSRDENEFLTERDITLINFMKLPNVLKSAQKSITDDLIANYICDFVK